jgi:hypothetical protein
LANLGYGRPLRGCETYGLVGDVWPRVWRHRMYAASILVWSCAWRHRVVARIRSDPSPGRCRHGWGCGSPIDNSFNANILNMVNLPRCLKQHNGALVGGAKATHSRGPSTFPAILAFPCWNCISYSAMQHVRNTYESGSPRMDGVLRWTRAQGE